MTKQLLWEEYTRQYPNRCDSYSQFCDRYTHWRGLQKRSMRQSHRAGEECSVDYCGQTVPIICADTGEFRSAQVFVAVLGASNYTYTEATWNQALPDWLGSHVRAFEYVGGTPAMVVPDNLKSGVSRVCRYDPDLNPSYQQLAAHYQLAVVPARPYKPKDKACDFPVGIRWPRSPAPGPVQPLFAMPDQHAKCDGHSDPHSPGTRRIRVVAAVATGGDGCNAGRVDR
jgi:transposase